jgi:hypothetical protein
MAHTVAQILDGIPEELASTRSQKRFVLAHSHIPHFRSRLIQGLSVSPFQRFTEVTEDIGVR